MRFKSISLAFAACLIYSATAIGNTSIFLYYYPPQPGGPLTVSCNDTTPLPSETLIYAFEDIDNDGTDNDDPLLQLAAIYPNGDAVGYGANRNRSEIGMLGYINLGIGYGGEGNPHPLSIYFRIFCDDGGILWESRVFVAHTLAYNEFITSIEDWTCYDCAPCEICDPTGTLYLDYNDGVPQDVCVSVCPNLLSWIFVTGLEWTYETTVMEITTADEAVCPELSCPDPSPDFAPIITLSGIFSPPAWCKHYVTANEPGCVQVTLTGLEGCNLDSISGEALPEANRIVWTVNREANLDYYELHRYQGFLMDWHVVAEIPSRNSDVPCQYSFIDTNVVNDTAYHYGLAAYYLNRETIRYLPGCAVLRYEVSETTDEDVSFIRDYRLHQNYPNPFNPSTSIEFELPHECNVVLNVYEVNGRNVVTLVDQTLPAGTYTAEFKAESLPSGVYFCKLTAGSYTDTKKMLLLK